MRSYHCSNTNGKYQEQESAPLVREFLADNGMTAAQTAYNQYAPILMTSVDTDPKLCAAERKAVFDRLSPGDWQIFGAHGAKKDVSVPDPA